MLNKIFFMLLSDEYRVFKAFKIGESFDRFSVSYKVRCEYPDVLYPFNIIIYNIISLINHSESFNINKYLI